MYNNLAGLLVASIGSAALVGVTSTGGGVFYCDKILPVSVFCDILSTSEGGIVWLASNAHFVVNL